jgi:hypothetical protein
MQVVIKKPKITDAYIIDLIKSGHTYLEVRTLAGCGGSRITRICEQHNLEFPRTRNHKKGATFTPKRRAKEDYKHDPHIPDDVKDINKCLTGKITDIGGRANPRLLAQQRMADRFTESKGMTFFDGVWIKDFRAWDNVIRELNKLLKAEGKRQIDYNREWVV